MDDFYTLLNLDSSLSTEEIANELIKAETIWIKRENNGNEKAPEKLVLIRKAKEVFSSEESRRQYDEKLRSGGGSTSSAEEAKKEQAMEWKEKAIGFYRSNQLDLATESINKAMRLVETLDDDGGVYAAAIDIFSATKDYTKALSAANNKILNDQYSPMGYYFKFMVFHHQLFDTPNTAANAAAINKFVHDLRDLYGVIMEKLADGHNPLLAGDVKARQAGVEYYIVGDKATGEKLAREAAALGEEKLSRFIIEESDKIRADQNAWEADKKAFYDRLGTAKMVADERKGKVDAFEAKMKKFSLLAWLLVIGGGILLLLLPMNFVVYGVLMALFGGALSFCRASKSGDDIIDTVKPVAIVMAIIGVAAAIFISYKNLASAGEGFGFLFKFIIGTTLIEAILSFIGMNIYESVHD